MSEKRKDAERRGRRAETLAAAWLSLKGYHIVARRFRGRTGEIDLIARRGRRIAIVEVKARARRETALEAISTTQRQRIERAASEWLARQPQGVFSLRFDVIAIVPWRLPAHIMDAWRPTGY
ncbi:YraN family protein [Kordiimonas marina]|uniref:YraN family protein n=1 Tax=Kordiimonas marina TaxID=2872312 RepID=UPI001FF5EBDE|nr:YraN family protein [Kordiimonas marina]MCJ9429879.1 YraN family protein [Kordiimonas marina]